MVGRVLWSAWILAVCVESSSMGGGAILEVSEPLWEWRRREGDGGEGRWDSALAASFAAAAASLRAVVRASALAFSLATREERSSR